MGGGILGKMQCTLWYPSVASFVQFTWILVAAWSQRKDQTVSYAIVKQQPLVHTHAHTHTHRNSIIVSSQIAPQREHEPMSAMGENSWNRNFSSEDRLFGRFTKRQENYREQFIRFIIHLYVFRAGSVWMVSICHPEHIKYSVHFQHSGNWNGLTKREREDARAATGGGESAVLFHALF